MSFAQTHIKIHIAQLLRLYNLMVNAAFAILLSLSPVVVGNLEVSLSMI